MRRSLPAAAALLAADTLGKGACVWIAPTGWRRVWLPGDVKGWAEEASFEVP